MIANPRFLPFEDVGDAFDTIAEAKPDNKLIEELLTFFEHTYIRGRRLRGRADPAYGPALFPIGITMEQTFGWVLWLSEHE